MAHSIIDTLINYLMAGAMLGMAVIGIPLALLCFLAIFGESKQ